MKFCLPFKSVVFVMRANHYGEGYFGPDRFVEALCVPLAMVILVSLFLVQRRGTGTIGEWFGPVVLAWFVTLAVLGIVHIARQPGVLAAISPGYGLAFFGHYGGARLFSVRCGFLVVTGGEALYADMGHFGKQT